MIYGLGFPSGTGGGGKAPQIVGSCMGRTPTANSNNATEITQTYEISYREGCNDYDFLVITPQLPPILAYTATTSSMRAGGHSNGNTENIVMKGNGTLFLYSTVKSDNVGTYGLQAWEYQATDTDITLTTSTSYNYNGYFSCVAYKY